MRVVLCDLDDTLFDHQRATRHALAELQAVTAALQGWSLDELDERHRVVLEAMHLGVLAGRTSVEQARLARFRALLEDAGVPEAAAEAEVAAPCYRRAYERCWHAVPGALDLAAAVKAAGFSLVIVTNNGVHEQRLKLDRCGLAPWVDALVTSEEVGACKPDARIFQAALAAAQAEPAEAVMLGDAWTPDVEGARAAGILPVWFNRHRLVTRDRSVAEIRSLVPAHAALAVLAGASLIPEST